MTKLMETWSSGLVLGAVLCMVILCLPAAAEDATAIGIQQRVRGTIDAMDPLGRSGLVYADRFSFEGQEGQEISIALFSVELNAYLVLIGPNGAVIAENDDGGLGCNARIPAIEGSITLPDSGNYIVEASGQHALLTGEYVLTLASEDEAPGPEDPVLFALEGKFRQETLHTYTVNALLGKEAAGTSITVSHPSAHDTIGRSQQILCLRHSWVPEPADTVTESDQMGNQWASATWSSEVASAQSVLETRFLGEASYAPILTRSTYPVELSALPIEASRWVTVDDWQAQAYAPEIRTLAAELIEGSTMAIQVIGSVIGWVQENVRMTPCNEPLGEIDAVSVLESRSSNCVGFSNLTVALLRAVGIPAVQVTGVVADHSEPDVAHAWAMAYLPEEGWLEFETSNWMPSWGDVPSTFLLPQHVTMHTGPGRGISSGSFTEQHVCDIEIKEWPTEREDVQTAIKPGQAASWAVAVRSPYFYEFFEHSAGYRDLVLDFSFDGIPEDWHADIAVSNVVLGSQANSPVPSRSILLTVVAPDDAVVGSSISFDLIAREGTTTAGNLTISLEVIDN